MTITQDKIIFGSDDWVSGLNPQYGTVGLVSGNGLGDATAFNPYRPYGVASPGFSSASVTNDTAITGLVVGGIPKYATGGMTAAILIDNSGLIHELTFATNTITNSGGVFPHAIDHAHSSEVGEDIVAYSVGTTRYAFYSLRDNTDWDIGRYDYVTTFDDDYMSTVAASPLAAPYITGGKDAPHPLIVGADDVLYAGDRNFIHGFDGQVGANGTFYPAILTLPAGYTITSFAKTPDFLVIFAYRQDSSDASGTTYGAATAFFWDYLSLDPTKVVELDDNYVNGGFTWKGLPGCFTTGRPTEYWNSSENKKSDLRLWDGAIFESVATFDGTIPVYRGVDVVSNEVMWNSGGEIFSYGEKIKGEGYKLNTIALSTSGSSAGFLKTLTATKQYVSTGTGASGGLLVFGTGYSNGSVKTIYVKPDFSPRQKGRVKLIEVFFYSLGGTGNKALTLNINMLGGTNSTQTIISNIDTFTAGAVFYEQDSSGALLTDFTHLGVEMAFSGGNTSAPPRPQYVIVHYEPINF